MPRNRPSSIEQLPQDILEQLQELLRDPRVTQLEATRKINVILENQGHDDRVSKSAVNRYAVRMEQVGERLRQSREMSKMWISTVGAEPQGETGLLINEMLRNLSFELSDKLMDVELNVESIPSVIESVKGLSLTVQRLEKAASENVKREMQIRKEAAEEERERCAKVVEEAAISQGMGEEQADFWRRKVLGVNR